MAIIICSSGSGNSNKKSNNNVEASKLIKLQKVTHNKDFVGTNWIAPGNNHISAIPTEIFKYVKIHPNFGSWPVWCEKMFLCRFYPKTTTATQSTPRVDSDILENFSRNGSYMIVARSCSIIFLIILLLEKLVPTKSWEMWKRGCNLRILFCTFGSQCPLSGGGLVAPRRSPHVWYIPAGRYTGSWRTIKGAEVY